MRHVLEEDRLESLRSYRLLDTGAWPELDDLVALAAQACDASLSVLCVVGERRLLTRAASGPFPAEGPRTGSPCERVVSTGASVVVHDVERSPDVPTWCDGLGRPVRAYVGVPVVPRDGLPVAVLSVMDVRPRRWSPRQVAVLRALAAQVAQQLELRRYDTAAGRRLDVPAAVSAGLRGALDAGQLTPHYQPIVDMHSGRPLGLEALLRWHRPDGSVLAPSQFLPDIESSGLIRPVGRHVLHRALSLLGQLRTHPAVPDLIGVCVNVSLTQLTEPGLAALILSELEAHRLPPGTLSLEITESSELLDDRCAVRELHLLREAGVHLAVDDYGTGYSSLMRVLELPISALKLDRSLVGRLLHDARALAVTRSTLAMAVDLGLSVVAEGIETAEQQQVLVGLGCPYGQGYLFGRALAPDDVVDALAPWSDVPAAEGSVARPAVTAGV